MYSSEVARACRLCSEHIFDDRAEPPMWPVNIVSTLWYLSKYFPRRLYAVLKRLQQNGASTQRIADLFRGTGRIAYVFHQTEFPIDGLSPDQADELFCLLLKCLSHYRKKDVYCEEMKNILWSDSEVSRHEKLQGLRTIAEEDNAFATLFGKANASLWLYAELINAAKHPYSHEFHGPYSIGNNRFLIARHYFDLRPTEIWPWTAGLSFEDVKTVEIYEGLNWGFSFFNHSESSSTAPKHLRQVGLSIDNQASYSADEGTLHLIVQACSDIVTKANEEVSGYSKTDWHVKLMELHHYYLKPFTDELGIDWHPSQELYDFVRNTPVDSTYQEFLDFIGSLFGTKSRNEGVDLLADRFVRNIYETRTRFGEATDLDMEV